jgi:hypothetical protein
MWSILLFSSSDSYIYFYISILVFPWALLLVLVLITILYLVPLFLFKVSFNQAALNSRCDVNYFVKCFGFLLIYHGVFDLWLEDVIILRIVCFVFLIKVWCNLVKFRGEFSNTHVRSLSKRIHVLFSSFLSIRVPKGFGNLFLKACIGVKDSISAIFPIYIFQVFLKVSHEWLELVKGGSSKICSSEKYFITFSRVR